MNAAPENYVSIVGDAYLQPISLVTDRLLSVKSDPNEVQSSMAENGYAVSACILLVAWFESWSMRVRYFNRLTPEAGQKHPVPFLSGLYPDLPAVAELTEVFVLRDTLVHNHLWLIQFAWGDESQMQIRGAQKEAFSGDRKYAQHVDLAKRRTNILGLNIVPTRIATRDVQVVLSTLWSALDFLAQKNPNFGIGHAHVEFRGDFLTLRQFVQHVGSF